MLFGLLDPLMVRGVVSTIDGLSEDSKKVLLKMDPFTAMMMRTFPSNISSSNVDPPTDETVKTEEASLGWERTGSGFSDWKQKKARERTMKLTKSLKIEIIRDDDFTGDREKSKDILASVLRWRYIFPVDDKEDVFFASNAEAETCLKDLRMSMGEGLPETYNSWEDMTTDESLTRIFFYGMGVVVLAAQTEEYKSDLGPFVVDMPLQEFEVRAGFRRLGARVHFGADQKPTAIFDYQNDKLVKPGEEGWEEAKFLCRTTVATLVTVREHLLWNHLLIANGVTNAMLEFLPPSHSIRRLLAIFTYGTNAVNSNAFSLLAPEAGLVHRASGFKYDALQDLFDAGYKASNIYEPFADHKVSPALKNLSDEGKFPYLSEGIAYFELVRSFVREWLDESGDAVSDDAAKGFYNEVKESTKGQTYELPDFETDDAMVNLISQMIFCVTAYHELVGGVVDTFRLPSRGVWRCTENATQMDAQSFLLSTAVAGTTSLKKPALMREFKNFFGAGGAPSWERDVWTNFVGKLKIQSTAVQAADAKREVEFKAFDPARFECSVSV